MSRFSHLLFLPSYDGDFYSIFYHCCYLSVIKIVKNNFWKQSFVIVIIDNKKVIFLFTDLLSEKNLDALTAQSVAQILRCIHVLIKSSQL